VIGGLRFAVARARAARAPLVTLAVVAAIATALVLLTLGAVRAVEARDLRAGLAEASGDRGRVTVTVDGATPEAVADAARAHVVDAGVAGAVVVSVDGSRVVITPALERITADDVPPLVDALDTLGDGIEDRTDAVAQVAGSLEATLSGLADAIEARRGPAAVAIGLLALSTAIVVGAVALEAVRARGVENHLLRARGARKRDLAGIAAGESFVVSLAGAVVGAGVAVAVVTVMTGLRPDPVGTTATVVALAVACALVASIVTVRGADRPSSRARAVASAGVAVVLAVLTGVAAWRFAEAGTPVVRRGDGAVILDPLVAIAPALILALAALVAVALATPLARGVAASVSKTRGVSPVTPLRLASRRPARHALSIVVVAFSIGTLTIAGSYQGALAALGDAPEDLRVGSDLRVGTIPEDVDTAEIAASQPANASMRVRPVAADSGAGRVQILAAEAASLGAVMGDAGGTIDPVALGDALALRDAGVVMGGDTLAFRFVAPAPPPQVIDGVEYEPGPPPAYGRATFLSGDGDTFEQTWSNFDLVETETDNGTYTDVTVDPDAAIEIPLPSGATWALAGLDVAMYPWAEQSIDVRILDATSGGEPVDLSSFRIGGTAGAVAPAEDATGLSFTAVMVGNDNVWTRAVGPGIPSRIPVVVTEALAESLSLTDGEAFSLDIDSPDFDADFEVAEIVSVLPGSVTGEGMLVDFVTFALATPLGLVPSQVWFATDDPAALAEVTTEEFPQTVTTVADPQAAESAAGTAVAFGAAAIGAVVMAVAVLVLRRTRDREDSRELARMAVMGLGRRGAARVRAREDLFAVTIGVIGGLVAGVATAFLIVPPLARAAYGGVPSAFPVTLPSPSLLLIVAVAASALVFAAIVATVRAPSALAPLLREDE
jgi:hypothetical protein